ncbi:conserved hypothetical protein [Hyella patelloides LEGE 07179]|uniref:Uncharacterized protein n=1 Tax=Hyella patelloides LEGE 07179 TaxID=945734 RepID=A0A563VPB2_9CYAN|nr:hypothetical protein [Hyella patelloides]VEP13263.1 conserved hypothetical protein [Hyella patelloides LEGE 07179]
MDTLQIQIKELEGKMNRLYQLVERIGERVETLSENKSPVPNAYSLSSFDQYQSQKNSEGKDAAYSLSHHKDILVDETSSNINSISGSERELSPEIQIRRLTAQLTAAYNRIAALEEQLLTYRIKS